jgi:hypothetical protein
MKRLKDLLAPAYLGFALSFFANLSFTNPKFWAILIPFLVIVKVTGFNTKENE